jgi:hypothetical protein
MGKPRCTSSMKASLNAWYVPGTIDSRVVDSFSYCLECVGLDQLIKTHHFLVSESESLHWNHGMYMDQICRESENDVEIFIDIDMLLFNADLLKVLSEHAYRYHSIAGVAHCVGHTPTHYDIFVGSPLIAISTQLMRTKPYLSCVATTTSDTCQLLNNHLRSFRVPLLAKYPIGYDHPPIGWFGNMGEIGRGIHYSGAYHLLAGGDDGGGSLRSNKEDAIQQFVSLAKNYQPPKYLFP